MIANIKHNLLETLTMAAVANKFDIGHKLHLNLDFALALTLLAAPAIDIEREKRWCHIHYFGGLLVGKKFADFVVCLYV